jgi:hypothetical protein
MRVLAQFSKLRTPCDPRDGIKTGAFNVPRRPLPSRSSTTEQIVLTTLADKVFTPSRVEIMLRELKKRQRAARSPQPAARSAEDARFQYLTRELKEIDTGIARLYAAVEKGLLPLDTTLQERSQKLQARRPRMCWSPARHCATNGKSRSTNSDRHTFRNSRMR